MRDLTFRLPRADGTEQRLTIQGSDVESILLRAAEHEAGHIIAAHHFHAQVRGIAVGLLPERSGEGMYLFALYGWQESSNDARCTVFAAGPAADVLYHGGFTEAGASSDLRDIKKISGVASLEPYLTKAKEILTRHERQFHCIAGALRKRIENMGEPVIGPITGSDRYGVLLLSEPELMECLKPAALVP